MSYVGLADLVRVLSVAKTKEEEDGMAKALGYERKEKDVDERDEEKSTEEEETDERV